MMYAKRIGKTAYGTHNENSANRHAVHSQLWNIDRKAGAENLVRKIDEDRHQWNCMRPTYFAHDAVQDY